jgi:excisionase family DNA binding protein
VSSVGAIMRDVGLELLTIDEVAARLRVSRKTLYNWRAIGTGPDGFRVGRTVRYRRESVDRWLREQEENDQSRLA